jgi:branched-chain amino acid transport system ATP-binding protein
VVLSCTGVTKRFGGVTAVDHVDLELREGQILGLIGQNGAGKTTLFDCVSGFLRVDEGRIEVRGTDVTDLRPEERAALGLGRSFQEARLFPSLTTAETLALARERRLLRRSMVAAALGQPGSVESERDVAEKVDILIELMGLEAFREKLTSELSTGTRRIVELACLLMSDPAVIVLDEPSGGVAQRETEALGPLLQRVQAFTGASILVIEHDMPLLSSICDELYALELGAVIARGAPAEVLEHPRVIESYLGTDAAAINRSGVAT